MVHSDDGDSGSSSSGSQDSGSTDSNDNSTVVTVVGDPGSEEGLTTVGRGDTIEESERDAATNTDFDADEGTDIDDLEESFGTDQADSNPDDSASDSTSVVVTENQQGEQVTVGQGQNLQGARNQAAANPNFDAAEGDPVDAFEEEQGFGQGDGTSTDVLRDRRQQRERQKRNTREPQRTDPGFFEQKATRSRNQDITPFEPENPGAVRDARNDQSDFFGLAPGGTNEELLETSVAISNRAGQVGDQVTQGLNTVSDFNPINTRPTNAFSRGFELIDQTVDAQKNGLNTSDALTIGATAAGVKTATQKQNELVGAGVQEIGETAALAPGTPGAFEELREDNTSVATAVAGGAALTGQQFKKNPAEFATNEVGGELFGFVPGASVITSKAPTPQALETSSRFIDGDLGTRATDTRAEINLEETEFFRRDFETREDGSRIQAVEGRKFTEGGTELSTGQGVRLEEPVSRRQFLKERAGLAQQKVSETLDANAAGIGPGGLLPKQKPDSTPDTSTDFNPDDVFVDQPGRTRTETRPDSNIAPPNLEDTQQTRTETGQDFRDRLEQPQRPEEDQPFENPPFLEQRPETDQPQVFRQSARQGTTPENKTPEEVVDPERKIIAESQVTTSKTGDSDLVDEQGDDDNGFNLFTQETKDTQFQASVGAEILGIRSEEKPERSEASDPTNLRPILED